MKKDLNDLMNDLFQKKNDSDVIDNDHKPKNKKFPKFIFVVMAVIFFLIFLATDLLYTVSERENAVVTRGGAYYTTKGAGLHFKLPIFDNVTLVDTRTKSLEIGYRTNSEQSVESESLMITSDFNFVAIDFFIEYKVSNASEYTFATTDPEEILKNTIQSEIRSIIARYTVDEVLTTAKTEIQSAILENSNKKIEDYNLGIYVEGVSIQDAEPPTIEVSNAFKAVESAKQNKETEINKANQYYNEEVPRARSDADKVIRNAESTKESRIAEANGQVSRFNEMFAEYIKNPNITKTRLYYEAMEEILPGITVYIDNGEGILKMLPLNE